MGLFGNKPGRPGGNKKDPIATRDIRYARRQFRMKLIWVPCPTCRGKGFKGFDTIKEKDPKSGKTIRKSIPRVCGLCGNANHGKIQVPKER